MPPWNLHRDLPAMTGYWRGFPKLFLAAHHGRCRVGGASHFRRGLWRPSADRICRDNHNRQACRCQTRFLGTDNPGTAPSNRGPSARGQIRDHRLHRRPSGNNSGLCSVAWPSSIPRMFRNGPQADVASGAIYALITAPVRNRPGQDDWTTTASSVGCGRVHFRLTRQDIRRSRRVVPDVPPKAI